MDLKKFYSIVLPLIVFSGFNCKSEELIIKIKPKELEPSLTLEVPKDLSRSDNLNRLLIKTISSNLDNLKKQNKLIAKNLSRVESSLTPRIDIGKDNIKFRTSGNFRLRTLKSSLNYDNFMFEVKNELFKGTSAIFKYSLEDSEIFSEYANGNSLTGYRGSF